MDFFNLKLSEKVGNIFEYAVTKQGVDFYTFTNYWVESDTFLALLEWDVTLVSQAPTYIYAKFLDEMQAAGKILKHSFCEEFPECIHWVGYVLTYWCLRDDITWKELQTKCDISHIIENCFVYHTIGVNTAIDMIQEECGAREGMKRYGKD